MRLGWYFKRLRNMGPGEIAHRLAEKTNQVVSRGRHEGWQRFVAPDGATLGLPGLREAVLQASPQQRASIATAAQRLLEGRFDALGVDWPQRAASDLFPAALWQLDPISGRTWPGSEAYCFDIDFRHQDRLGDIKYVWEINRLQFLQPLAAHALLNADAHSVAAVEAAIASWHAANPPFRGTGWASGIEVALRSISLLVAASLCGERFSPPTKARLGEILAASAFWLPRFPSKFSSANNHLMAELAGEFLVEMALYGKADATRAMLLGQVQRQILPDGTGAEQSPTYAAFSVELALLCALVARTAGASFPPAFDARVAAFAEFVGWIASGGVTPSIGDDDEGRVLTLCQPEADYARSVAAAISGFLGKPGAPAAEFRNLVFGNPAASAPAPLGLKSFAEGGYSAWHGTCDGHAVDLIFDHGPLGYLSIAAHGHADALSLQLSIDGQPVLVDPGTYLYGAGGLWRSWFRGTAAHNTLNLGAHQSIMAGAFNWSHKAVARLDEARAGSAWRLAASHDGYLSRFGVRHERDVEGRPGGIVVTDRLTGATPQDAELVFQLAPDLTAQSDGATVSVLRAAAMVLRIEFPPGAVLVRRGGDTPGAGGWVSPRFGVKLPADRIAWRGRVGAGGVITRLHF